MLSNVIHSFIALSVNMISDLHTRLDGENDISQDPFLQHNVI